MPVDLVINATILNQPRLTGLGVYAAALLAPLLKLCVAEHQFSKIIVAGQPDRLRECLGAIAADPRIQIRTVLTLNPAWRLLALDRLIVAERGRSKNVLFYSPTHHGVMRGGIRQVITIHDLFARLFPQNYRQQYRYFRWYLPRILARTNRVMVDSANTAMDLRRFYPDSPPSEVIHAALRPDLPMTEPCMLPLLHGHRFFLFVGPSYAYKNGVRLIDAFARFRTIKPVKLVFAGGREEYVRDLRRHQVEHHPALAGEIVFLDYPSTGELAWLYRNAAALMLTTLYEGFGLPALEAMACDCPVVASRAGSLPEVCGDAALMIDPEDVDSMTEAMSQVIANDDLRQSMIASGRRNVRRFSWETSAEKVYRILLALVEDDSAGHKALGVGPNDESKY
ncbi:MAG: glycosyltransferase family 1 protein [candidate division Zixibacteria bacterium]|nr:glycosyltransferase family 1 protein [candidate division Zixibacteria bacterium]